MRWPWAVILSTAVLMGCRGSQPARNPFMRTTVPPPATGQGAMVTPGEPYYPASTPPAYTPGTLAPPPVTTGPPLAAPPQTLSAPPNDKYAPPGGSFQYTQ